MTSAGGVVEGKCDTFPKLLLRNAVKFKDRPAIREKDLGIWQSWTWSEVKDEVQRFSIGLHKLGLTRGDKLAIVGQNRPRLYWAFAAAQALGAIPVPVYQDSVADELVFVFDHAEAHFILAEDQEQVDKVLSIADKLPKLKVVIYDDERGLKDYNTENLYSFAKVQNLGAQELAENSDAEPNWLAEIDKGGADDLAVMLYTSGTTGTPKGVMLSQNNIIVTAVNSAKFDKLNEHDDIIAYLPMAWVGDHIFSYGQSYVTGFCVSCPESHETLDHDRLEIGPSYFFAPPRSFENMLTSITVRMEDAGPLKKKMVNYFLDFAKNTGEKLLNGEAVPFADRLKYSIGDFLVYAPLKNRLGLSNVRVGYTAGEAIGPEIFSFFRSIGINLKQLYGQTEASVYVTIQPDGEIYSDTVGPPAPDTEIKISDTGEVMFRSPGVFVGYYKNDKATAETKTKDGWVHSGDAGFFDERGHLKIIDRAKDVGKLNAGTIFPPKYIENKLKFFSTIKEVVAFGHEKDYCAAFVNIDLVAVSSWAERNNIIYASYQELASHPGVYEMMQDCIEQVNADLAKEGDLANAQIKRFLVLHKELDPDDGEITRTNKVRRSLVADRYAPLIDALYDTNKTRQHIETEVTFEDGRKGKISADLEIRDARVFPPINQNHKEAAE